MLWIDWMVNSWKIHGETKDHTKMNTAQILKGKDFTKQITHEALLIANREAITEL